MLIDSNATKKESIADLVAGMAGAGLIAASGQLSVQGNKISNKVDADTLEEGFNIFTDCKGSAIVKLPSNQNKGVFLR